MYRFLLLILVLPLVVSAQTLSAHGLPREAPVPGGIKLLRLPPAADGAEPAGRFLDREVLTLRADGEWWAVVGLPLDLKPGMHELTVRWGESGPLGRFPFAVDPKDYATQHLTIKNKRKVNPNPEDMARIRRENAVIGEAKRHWDPRLMALSFRPPVAGPETSPFGLRRYFNGQPRRPHGGQDIAAAEGTPVVAPAAGRVLLTGEFFFNGNSVFLDHGRGLISFFAHLSSIEVKSGSVVQAPTCIGACNSTEPGSTRPCC